MKILGKNKYEQRKNFIIFLFIIILLCIVYLFFINIRNGVINVFYFFNSSEQDQIEKIQTENSILKNQITDLIYKNNILKNNIILKNNSHLTEYILLKSIISENIFYNSLILKSYDYKDYNVLDRIRVGDIVYIKGLYPVGIVEMINDKSKDTLRLKLFSYKDFSFTILLENNNSSADSSTDKSQDLTNEDITFTSSTNIIDDNKITNNRNFYDVGATGDGMYGVYAYIPKDKKVKIGQKVYYKGNENKEIGTISNIDFIEKENLQKIFIKTYYKDNQDSDFFIKI